MTPEEREHVLTLLRNAGLRIIRTEALADGSMTVRIKRLEFKR